uniref:Allatostatin C preprohormone n=1 Tax=Daphnia galeata TaxID=27404 RepID=A0A8J2W9P4_9CRUS|nr:unnamed protein product [Daphnia galeata]
MAIMTKLSCAHHHLSLYKSVLTCTQSTVRPNLLQRSNSSIAVRSLNSFFLQHILKMISKISAMISVAIILYLAASGVAKSTDRYDTESTDFDQDIQLGAVPDDGSVETALLNYLFAKQIMTRLRNNGNPQELMKKRSYWKQCAFNAVSCFGK